MKRIVIAIILLACCIGSLFMNITVANKVVVAVVCIFGAVTMLRKPDENSDNE